MSQGVTRIDFELEKKIEKILSYLRVQYNYNA